MILTRTFHPIGHGAFYTEIFLFDNKTTFNVVYDCGAMEKKMIEKKIKDAFNEEEQIDALFISHLHRDHINGLEKLFAWCNVKRLFMPIISNDDLALSVISNYDENEPSDLINDLILYANGDRQIINIKEKYKINNIIRIQPEDNNEYNSNEQGKGRNIEDFKDGDSISSGSKLTISDKKASLNTFWQYIPYNPIEGKGEVYKNIRKELKKIDSNLVLKKEIDIQKLLEAMKDKEQRNKIVAIYKKIKVKGGKEHNCYSMTLFSGLYKQSKDYIINNSCKYNTNEFSNIHCCYCCNKYRYLINCMYLGDINLKDDLWNPFFKRYKDVYNYVRIVQIPHHGSIGNYNTKINEGYGKLSILSVPNNDILHPNKDVLNHIIALNGTPICVNTNNDSKVELKYDFDIA